MKRCVIIGSAPIENDGWLQKNIRTGDYVICADGGYHAAKRTGVVPRLLVGDFDSYRGELPQDIEIIRLPVEKDDTDMMFCVKEGIRRGYDAFLLLGGLGGRLDHTIANLSALLYLAKHGMTAVLSDEQNEAVMALDGEFVIENRKGELMSLFPFGGEDCCVSYEGLMYPLSKATLHSDFPLGVSNCVLTDRAVVHIHKGPVLLLFSKDKV